MPPKSQYRGILFMLMASIGFSCMGGAAKLLGNSFNAGQLVFWRNAVGLLFLLIGFGMIPPKNKGGKFRLLLFRGLMGTTALYTLLYCILHIPLGTAMTYNLTSALFIAVFSFLLFREYHGRIVLAAVLLGFAGMLLIYKPSVDFPWYYHLAGLASGVTSALAYLTVNRLSGYYDTRIVVLSFILTGVIVPVSFMAARYLFGIQADDVFFINWRWPQGREWIYVLALGSFALTGQYFVTRAYSSDRPGIVSAFSYASIPISVFIGVMLGDAFPDAISAIGIACIIISGILIAIDRVPRAVKPPA